MIMPSSAAARAAKVEGCLIVAACGPTRGIGKDGKLPWPKLNTDLQNFKSLTLNGAVVMGSKTYFSLPKSVRPLPGRLNIILSSRSRAQLHVPDNVLVAGSMESATALLSARGFEKMFIIGGESVFRTALSKPEWSARVHYTEIDTEFTADRFFPIDLEGVDSGFSKISLSKTYTENHVSYRICEFVRDAFLESQTQQVQVYMRDSTIHAEYQYLNLVKRILRDGVQRGDRTGTGTKSIFGAQMRFDLRNSFPLLTTKRVFWRGVVEELLWFVRGSTNANELSDKGIHIWDGNGSREFLDNCGFQDREVGDLGPVYGFQWRHFGAKYENMRSDYTGKGVDQLQDVIHTIKTKPNDRRIIICAWNPSAIPEMALPPCHLLAQFYVADGELSCQMYQRSCDMGLGVPFNIASYALLTCLIARTCGLRAGEFVHTLGDAHVYNNHLQALQLQVQRVPRQFPTVEIKARENIEDFCIEDIVLHGYEPHRAIPMKMAI